MGKIFYIIFIALLLFSNAAFAEPQGKLSVFTDVKEAEIYVDSAKIGQENVVGYSLSTGEHYLKVMYKGNKAYAEIVNIIEGQTKTVVVDNFVDFKTNAPSRGAVDKEAARLRETRGNMCFGAFGSSPASGLSYKWWVFDKFGFQVVGFAQNLDSNKKDDTFGYRILFGFADKVYQEDTITAYAALGRGRGSYIDRENGVDNVFFDTTEGAFGLELKLAKDVSIPNINGDVMSILMQLMTLGILNTCYVSLELGAESRYVIYGDTTRRPDNLTYMKVSGGLHYYF
jgi:hypothetical protein